MTLSALNAAAKAAGQTRFTAPIACPRHPEEFVRSTTSQGSGLCIACHREQARRYRTVNQDRVRQQQRRRYHANAEHVREQSRLAMRRYRAKRKADAGT